VAHPYFGLTPAARAPVPGLRQEPLCEQGWSERWKVQLQVLEIEPELLSRAGGTCSVTGNSDTAIRQLNCPFADQRYPR
jgi:hypothetical protein